MFDKKTNSWNVYTIMHGNREVASIRKNGTCQIYAENFMPYNLYFETDAEGDIEIRLQNLENFYYWCASRVLSLNREYAKEILNSIGATQATTDRDRAQIALSYHCLSLMDIYWTRAEGEQISFEEINLYENHLEKAFIDVSLRGKQLTIQNSHLIADDLATHGCFPKAWVRKENAFWLMKDGGIQAVENELLASKICRCFNVNQVFYEEDYYDGQKVSVSRIVTSPEVSIVPMESFEIYAQNHGIDRMEYILKLDQYSYYMMNILDYLIGNTDRHWGNWGLLVDNRTNMPIRLYDLMDFNRAFQSYETIDGARCLTCKKLMVQKEAAIEAVKEVGLNQISRVSAEWFADANQRKMFFKRLNLLNKNLKNS